MWLCRCRTRTCNSGGEQYRLGRSTRWGCDRRRGIICRRARAGVGEARRECVGVVRKAPESRKQYSDCTLCSAVSLSQDAAIEANKYITLFHLFHDLAAELRVKQPEALKKIVAGPEAIFTSPLECSAEFVNRSATRVIGDFVTNLVSFYRRAAPKARLIQIDQ